MGVGVGIPLLILIMAGLALVVAVSKLKKTFQRRLTERGKRPCMFEDMHVQY